MGADCLLLIAAVLTRSELSQFHQLAIDLGLALVEVHDELELEFASRSVRLIGINQRN